MRTDIDAMEKVVSETRAQGAVILMEVGMSVFELRGELKGVCTELEDLVGEVWVDHFAYIVLCLEGSTKVGRKGIEFLKFFCFRQVFSMYEVFCGWGMMEDVAIKFCAFYAFVEG